MLFRGLLLPLGAALCGTAITHAQVAFTGSHTEDFDGLGPTGTTLPEGWAAVRAGGSGTLGAALTPGITAGTATGGGIYNVGITGDPDRALGSLASSSTYPQFGAQFLNASGLTFHTLDFSGVMEQWRSGNSAATDEALVFEYSFDAAGIADPAATWLAFSPLSLAERLTATTSAGAVDGNQPENQLQLGGTLNGIDWADGTTLTFRWTDTDDVGSDGLYALDQFRLEASIAPVPEPTSLALLGLGLGIGWTALRRRSVRRRV